MMLEGADIRDGLRKIRVALGGGGPAPGKPGKYKIAQKLYHLAAAVLVLSIIASGLLMLLKIDTPFWKRNPYWFDSDTWGIIYSVHGFGSLAMITLVMIHIYFALRPEEWWLTRSMFGGTVIPSNFRASGSFSTMSTVIPRYAGFASGSVLHSRTTMPGRRPLVTHIFVPFTT